MQKQEQEAIQDLKKTLAAPSEKINWIFMDFGSILGSILVPKSIQNRIEIWVENRYPKNRPKTSPKGAIPTIDSSTSESQGSPGGRGESINQSKITRSLKITESELPASLRPCRGLYEPNGIYL